jgi:hypothetical protein
MLRSLAARRPVLSGAHPPAEIARLLRLCQAPLNHTRTRNTRCHPQSVFSTSGGDGTVNFWDREKKSRTIELKVPQSQPRHMPSPVSAACWNPAGDLFAYAGSYDWAKGVEGYNLQAFPTQLLLHWTTQADLRPPPPPPQQQARR